MAESKIEDITVNEEKKLTADELKEVQSYDQKFQQIQFGLGEVLILKNNLKERKQSLLSQLKEETENQNKMRESLQEKYGSVSVDKNTGLITEAPLESPKEGENAV